MILDFTAYWNNQNDLPFTNKSIHVANLQNSTLAILICGEIVYYVSSTVYADSEIQSVKSGSGRNHTHILSLPASMFRGSIPNESPKELSIVIERSVLLTATDLPSPTMHTRLLASSKPTLKEYKSKWELSDAIAFQTAYEAAQNKETYLLSLSMDEKPCIDHQFEAIVVDFLNDSGLGYKGGSGGEEVKAKNALKLLGRVVKFMNGRRSTMGRSRVMLYDSSALLRAVRGCVSAKVRHRPLSFLTKEILLAELKKVEECLSSFPSSYYRKVRSGSNFGKPIFDELEIWKGIIAAHHNDMHMQDVRNRESRVTMAARSPSSFNTKTFVVPPKM